MSKYAKQTCVECGQMMMANDGLIPQHHVKGTRIPCDGSMEYSVESEAENEVSTFENNGNGHVAETLQLSENAAIGAKDAEIILQNIPFQIEKGVPIPARNGQRKSKYFGVLKALEIGDSFVCTYSGRGHPATLIQQARKMNIKLTARRINESEVRVWRIK
jgi:hypothetical protein